MVYDEPRLSVELAGEDRDDPPRRLRFGSRTVDVVEVVDRWLAADHRYFKIVGDDGAVYVVRYDAPTDRWDLALYDSGLMSDPTVH